MTWDPTQYGRFADERSRPFHELVSRIGASAEVTHVVDLGCGSGELTATLAQRWSHAHAHVLGVDSDINMLAAAAKHANARLQFEHGDIATWRPRTRVDVMISNAAYQWVPNHLALLPELFALVEPGGWFALQVPGNLDDPHHQAIRRLVRSGRWQREPGMAAIPDRTHSSHTVVAYMDALTHLSDHIDGWETTYVHILHGADPVLEWVKGTALRPVLAALPSQAMRDEFCAELGAELRELYPAKPWGTPFPFKRVFVVAQRKT